MAGAECLIGLDLGSSRVKAAAYDLRGNALAVRISPMRTVRPQQGWAHYEAADVREAVLDGLAALTAGAGLIPRAIGIASIGEAGFLVDQDSQPLYPAITWFDHRTEDYRAKWEEKIGGSELYTSSGMNPDHIYSVYKILWLRDNHPELFAKAERWLCMEDYVINLLTGEAVTDYTIASRTALFDRRTKTWNERLMALAGLRPTFFPAVRPSGQAVGRLRRQVAERCGLPAETLVCTGGHDHVCAAFAIGLLDPGSLMDSMGTAEAIKSVAVEPPGDGEVMAGHFDCYPHVVPGRYVISGHNPAAGATLEWVRREADARDGDYFAELSRLALSSPIGAGGVIFLPFMEGSGTPHGVRSARGAVYGLTTSTTMADLARAFFEGTCFWLLDNLQVLERFLGNRIDRILATGGGAESEAWVRLKADVTGRPVIGFDLVETAALGAAFLAGSGAGLFANHREASAAIQRRTRIVEPSPENVRTYAGLFTENYLPWKGRVLAQAEGRKQDE